MGSGVSTSNPARIPVQHEAKQGVTPILVEGFTLQSIHDHVMAQPPKAAALGAPHVPSLDAFVILDNLPECLSDLHNGMPTALQRAPLRLLKLKYVLKWSHLKAYEDVDHETECLTLPYCTAGDDVWKRVATVSWRWSEPKPAMYNQKFSPMSEPQFSELKALLKFAADGGIEYLWIDWSCVPQYTSEAMVEVHRSKVYFARARALRIVPSYRPLPSEGPMRLVLVKAGKALSKRAEETGSLRCGIAAAIVTAILTKSRVARRDYFSRIWTLAERMARFGRNEGLYQWLSLESWLGMVVDAMLDEGAGDGATSAVYRRMLGGKAASILDAVLDPLAAAARVGGVRTRACEGLEGKVAQLLEEAVAVWLSTPCLIAEAPAKGWLCTYLGEEGPKGMYQAWREADRVWAIYSYFCWKQNLDQRSAEGLRIALEDLVEIASGDRDTEALRGMFALLGVAAPAAAAAEMIGTQQQQQQQDTDAQAAVEAGNSDGPCTAGGSARQQARKTGSSSLQEMFNAGSRVTISNLQPSKSSKCGTCVVEPMSEELLGTSGMVEGIDKDGNVRVLMDQTGTSQAWNPALVLPEGAQLPPVLASGEDPIDVWIPRFHDVNNDSC